MSCSIVSICMVPYLHNSITFSIPCNFNMYLSMNIKSIMQVFLCLSNVSRYVWNVFRGNKIRKQINETEKKDETEKVTKLRTTMCVCVSGYFYITSSFSKNIVLFHTQSKNMNETHLFLVAVSQCIWNTQNKQNPLRIIYIYIYIYIY